jgi:two-component system, chemotaxis family, CheB/CheR fusion protein
LNIAFMARKGLFLEIRQAVDEARDKSRRVRKENVKWGDSPDERVTLEITPVRPRQGSIESFLIIFEPLDPNAVVKPPAPAVVVPAEQEMLELRSELQAAHEYVQSVIEQQDASTEELRSANEEIMSANEELQSSNEELETAKEELQSTNEELTTLNEELQNRNFELAQLTDDLLNLLSSLRLPILMISGDMLIRRFTPGATKAFNLLGTDIGRPLSDIRPGFDLPELLQLIRNVISDVAPVEREVKDRSGKWQLLRIHPYRTTDNRIDGAVLTLLDIHAARTAAEKLKAAADYTSAIIEYLLDPLLLLDEHLSIESANKAYCELVGCTPAELAGKPFHKVNGGMWNVPDLRDKMARVVDQGATIEDYVIEREVGKAGPRTFSVRARLLKEQVDKPRIIVVLNDVTNLHQAAERERALSEAERTARMDAEQANRTKDQFLAMLSHELRNPLNAVLGWTKVLKSKKTDADALAEGLHRIEAAAQAQVRMISDLLDISRISAGKMELDLKSIDLPEVVDAAVEMFVPVAESKKVHLVRNYHTAEATILADPQRLQQIVANLLSNAVKFTPPGGKVEVGLSDVDHSVQIVVRDTGPGIDPEFQKHMFERFRQAEMPGTTKFAGGLGLGLAIVKHLVTLHGGTVEAHSEGKDKGAEFTVTIPYSDIHFDDVPRPPTPRTVTHHAEPRDLTGLRVLLVDDDPDACAIARRIFEEHQIKVYIALSAREGLNILKYERPDIIVSDIGMPDQDGYELMRQIRSLPVKKGGATPAIALTAFARPEDRKQALAVGYQKHMAKPVDPLELLTVIATLTSDKRQSNA